MVNVHALIAVGVNAERYREILGIDINKAEDGAGCPASLWSKNHTTMPSTTSVDLTRSPDFSTGFDAMYV